MIRYMVTLRCIHCVSKSSTRRSFSDFVTWSSSVLHTTCFLERLTTDLSTVSGTLTCWCHTDSVLHCAFLHVFSFLPSLSSSFHSIFLLFSSHTRWCLPISVLFWWAPGDATTSHRFCIVCTGWSNEWSLNWLFWSPSHCAEKIHHASHWRLLACHWLGMAAVSSTLSLSRKLAPGL